MAARPLLFSKQFERLHGMTLGQAVSGYIRHDDRIISPQEAPEYFGRFFRPEWTAPTEPDPIDKQLHRWAMNHNEFLVGDTQQVATNLVHLNEHIQRFGKRNEQPIYRGDSRSPQELASIAPDQPQAFTTDRFVARSFAKPSYAGKEGRVWKQDPGTVSGLLLSDYGANKRTVGRNRRKESEFLVDPSSIGQR